jgi:hypothetical protein
MTTSRIKQETFRARNGISPARVRLGRKGLVRRSCLVRPPHDLFDLPGWSGTGPMLDFAPQQTWGESSNGRYRSLPDARG